MKEYTAKFTSAEIGTFTHHIGEAIGRFLPNDETTECLLKLQEKLFRAMRDGALPEDTEKSDVIQDVAIDLPDKVTFIIDGIRRSYTIADFGWDFRGKLFYVLKNDIENVCIISKTEYDLLEKEEEYETDKKICD